MPWGEALVDRNWAIRGVLLTLAAWGCWQGMESVPDFSPTSTALFYGGFVLVGLALYALYRAYRSPKS
jgi:hypothetical protein